MSKYTIGGFNRITWIGASIFAVGALTLIFYALGIRIRFVDVVSAMFLGLPTPIMASLVMLVGGLVSALGYWIDRQDEKRMRELRRGGRSDKRNDG